MTAWFSSANTPLAGLDVVTSRIFEDTRGEFARLYCDEELAGIGAIRQINRSLTRSVGDVRGLHFQHPPYAETKVVRCIGGEAWDVAVDIRRESPTFLQWHAQTLSPGNRHCMVIPPGFAHGFQALTPDCELLYLHTERYAPEAEDGLRYDDPMLNIAWPLEISNVSARDSGFALINQNFEGLG